MAEAGLGQTIAPAIVLMGAAVVAVPLFRRLGLGSVLGYFTAGVLVSPSALGRSTTNTSGFFVLQQSAPQMSGFCAKYSISISVSTRTFRVGC